MADGFSASVFTKPAQRGLTMRQARMPRAAMWALRQAGREVRKEAVRAAPVLKDKTKLSHRQLQRQRRAGADVKAAYQKPVPGLLKASIRPSRQVFREGPDRFRLRVGPRGQRVHLYAGKMEDRYGYMRRGEAAGEAAIEVAAVQAFNRVWKYS